MVSQTTGETLDADDKDDKPTTENTAPGRRLMAGGYTAPVQRRQEFLWQLGSALGAGGVVQDIALGGVDLDSSLGDSLVSVGAYLQVHPPYSAPSLHRLAS